MVFIDSQNQEILTDGAVRERFMPTIINRFDGLETEDLAAVGVGVITIVDTPPPDVSPPYSVVDAGYDKDTPGEWVQQWEVVSPSLEDAKSFARQAVQNAYELAKLAPVVVDGRSWKGGFESAQGIKGALDWYEASGLAEVTLFDVHNQAHVCTLAEARSIVLSVGAAYMQVFATRAGLLQAIDAAETMEGALAVSWPVE